MNFELKTLSLAAAAAHKCDLLVVLVPEGFLPGSDVLSTMVAHALKQGDLEVKPGKLLQCYAPAGVAARRVVLLGCGAADAHAVRQAMQALAPSFKLPSVKRVALVFGTSAQRGAIGAAVRAVADGSYVTRPPDQG